MKENGFEYVDLGLPSKTMWATCNVGATKPEDEGLLFQFGRVYGYKYGDKNHKFITDYKTTTSGKTYKTNEILDLSDDAAHVNMGGKWRMPTYYQLSELFYNTTQEVEIINGIKGMTFTSTKPGYEDKRLFIPFMRGCWYNGNWEKWNMSSAYVLSSQVHVSNVNDAYRLNCYCYSFAYVNVSNSNRSFAYSVRGVFRK